MKRLLNNKGFSLAESLVAVLIFSFILVGLTAAFVAGNQSWNAHDAMVRSQQEARNALITLSRDLRVADNITIVDNPGDVTLSFNHPVDGAVSYVWANTGNDANRVLRGTTIIAHDISALTFTDTASDITINISSLVQTLNGDMDAFQLSKKVAKRE